MCRRLVGGDAAYAGADFSAPICSAPTERSRRAGVVSWHCGVSFSGLGVLVIYETDPMITNTAGVSTPNAPMCWTMVGADQVGEFGCNMRFLSCCGPQPCVESARPAAQGRFLERRAWNTEAESTTRLWKGSMPRKREQALAELGGRRAGFVFGVFLGRRSRDRHGADYLLEYILTIPSPGSHFQPIWECFRGACPGTGTAESSFDVSVE